MKVRIMFNIVILVSILTSFVICPTAVASLALDYSPAMLIETSDTIVVGTVKVVEFSGSDYRIVVEVSSYLRIKPETKRLVLNVGEGSRFVPQEGASYIFLLSSTQDSYKIEGYGAGMYELVNDTINPIEIQDLLESDFIIYPSSIRDVINTYSMYVVGIIVSILLVIRKASISRFELEKKKMD